MWRLIRSDFDWIESTESTEWPNEEMSTVWLRLCDLSDLNWLVLTRTTDSYWIERLTRTDSKDWLVLTSLCVYLWDLRWTSRDERGFERCKLIRCSYFPLWTGGHRSLLPLAKTLTVEVGIWNHPTGMTRGKTQTFLVSKCLVFPII